MTPPFAGIGVALVTLFHDDLELDVAATADLAVRLVDAGVSAVVVAGSTGEASALSREERVALLRGVRDALPTGRATVIAGTGAPSARQAAVFTADAAEHGADAALVLAPPSSSDVRPYYDTIAKATPDLALLAYHYPAVAAPGIALAHLADLPVVGLKDSTGDADRLLAEMVLEGWNRPVYTGSSALLSLAGPLGCPGAILALANAEPELCIAAFAGDAAAQLKLAPAHLGQRRAFPAAIKEMTAARFGTSTARRMG